MKNDPKSRKVEDGKLAIESENSANTSFVGDDEYIVDYILQKFQNYAEFFIT